MMAPMTDEYPFRLPARPRRPDVHRDRCGSRASTGARRRARRRSSRWATTSSDLQERLFAEGKSGSDRRVLLVLQGMDTSGKGGVLRHTVGLVDPQGVRITSFKAPTEEERAHDFLWRIRRAVPQPGYIGVFDRSHYEDVLIARVRELADPDEIERRYAAINDFERELVDGGTTVVKCMLHISAGGAEGAPPRPARRPDQALEVQPRRRRRAGAVAALPGGLRDRPGADQHRARAVARDPQRQEVVPEPGHRQAAARRPARRWTRSGRRPTSTSTTERKRLIDEAPIS